MSDSSDDALHLTVHVRAASTSRDADSTSPIDSAAVLPTGLSSSPAMIGASPVQLSSPTAPSSDPRTKQPSHDGTCTLRTSDVAPLEIDTSVIAVNAQGDGIELNEAERMRTMDLLHTTMYNEAQRKVGWRPLLIFIGTQVLLPMAQIPLSIYYTFGAWTSTCMAHAFGAWTDAELQAFVDVYGTPLTMLENSSVYGWGLWNLYRVVLLVAAVSHALVSITQWILVLYLSQRILKHAYPTSDVLARVRTYIYYVGIQEENLECNRWRVWRNVYMLFGECFNFYATFTLALMLSNTVMPIALAKLFLSALSIGAFLGWEWFVQLRWWICRPFICTCDGCCGCCFRWRRWLYTKSTCVRVMSVVAKVVMGGMVFVPLFVGYYLYHPLPNYSYMVLTADAQWVNGPPQYDGVPQCGPFNPRTPIWNDLSFGIYRYCHRHSMPVQTLPISHWSCNG